MTTLFNHFHRVAAALVLAVGFWTASTAQAVTINGDFSTAVGSIGGYTGLGAAPDAGTYWNNVEIDPTPNANFISVFPWMSDSLLASDGVTDTGDTVSLTMAGWMYIDEQASAGFAPELLSDRVGIDGIFSESSLTFTFSGLTLDGEYDLYLYSQNGASANGTTFFDVGGDAKIAQNTAAANSGFVEGDNYVKYEGIVASGGVISGQVTFTGSNGYFNGFQLVSAGETNEIPEPSSLVLAGLAALGGLFVVRRKTRKA